ncbi:MAG: nonribosomal peptide synthetase MxaA, partial [Hyphomicrobium sp.]
RKLTVPGFTLRLMRSEGAEDVAVPAWSFVISPLRELFAGAQTGDASAVALQPDAKPLLLPTRLERGAILVSAPLALAALLVLARHMAWWPFRESPHRPFTEAARFLRVHGTRLAGAGGYRSALLKLHRAFDLAAGRRVLPDDIGLFLRDHPKFVPISQDIARVFAASREAFFGVGPTEARAALPIPELADIAERLGEAERGAS